MYSTRRAFRDNLRAQLGDSREQMFQYLEHFPRDVDVWLRLIDCTPPSSSLEDVFDRALDRCRKSTRLWQRYLELIPDPDIEECVDAVGRNWDSGPILRYIINKLRPGPKLLDQIKTTCVNSDFLEWMTDGISRSENQSLFELKRSFEANLSSLDEYIDYVVALREKGYLDEAESVYQRMIFDLNDYPDPWISYAVFLVSERGSPNHAEQLLTKACTVFAPCNYLLKFESANFFFHTAQLAHKASELLEQVINECWLDLDVIHQLTLLMPDRAIGILKSLIGRFGNSEGVNAIRLMLIEHAPDDSTNIMDEILASVLSRDDLLPLVDVVPFCFAVLNSTNLNDRIRKDVVLFRNSGLIGDYFRADEWPSLFPKDDKGRSPPPRPVRSAPPKPEQGLDRQQRAAKRALPGYTPGWLAAEYAKRHSI